MSEIPFWALMLIGVDAVALLGIIAVLVNRHLEIRRFRRTVARLVVIDEE